MRSIYLSSLLTLIFGVWLVQGRGHQSQLPGDSAVARTLFALADENMDGILSFAELDGVFKAFDIDDDGEISEHEFITDWTSRGLGDVWEAVTLFKNLDTDKSGALTEDPDLIRVQKYFDEDHDGNIIQSEFVVQWIKLSSS